MKIDILEAPKYPVRNSKHSAQNRYPVPKHVGEYLSGITPKHVATLSVKLIFKDSHDEWYVSKELMVTYVPSRVQRVLAPLLYHRECRLWERGALAQAIL